MSFVIAIDGPAASGKGTLARRLAEYFHLPHLDTGLLYRATACVLLDNGASLLDEALAERAARGLSLTDFDARRLRSRELGEASSIVASIPAVRAALIDLQRQFATRTEGTVIDGRDIGTVICPEASVKIFVTASPETRAQRRVIELIAAGESADYTSILSEVKQRDARDLTRSISPLVAANDAVMLDTTELDRDAAFNAALAIIQKVRQLDA